MDVSAMLFSYDKAFYQTVPYIIIVSIVSNKITNIPFHETQNKYYHAVFSNTLHQQHKFSHSYSYYTNTSTHCRESKFCLTI